MGLLGGALGGGYNNNFGGGFGGGYGRPTQSPVISFQAVGPNGRPAFSLAGNDFGFYLRNKNKQTQSG